MALILKSFSTSSGSLPCVLLEMWIAGATQSKLGKNWSALPNIEKLCGIIFETNELTIYVTVVAFTTY